MVLGVEYVLLIDRATAVHERRSCTAGPALQKCHGGTMPLQMMTCLFNSFGLVLGVKLRLPLPFFSVQNGIRITTTF